MAACSTSNANRRWWVAFLPAATGSENTEIMEHAMERPTCCDCGAPFASDGVYGWLSRQRVLVAFANGRTRPLC